MPKNARFDVTLHEWRARLPVGDRWRPGRRKWRLLGATSALLLTVTSLSSCHSQRSVASYCQYFYGVGSTLRDQWMAADEQTDTNPLGTLVTLLGAPGQLAGFFDSLSQRAPDEIAGDVQTVAHAFRQLSDSEGGDAIDPLGGLASGLATGLSSAAAFQRVDDWTEQHCGPPPTSQ